MSIMLAILLLDAIAAFKPGPNFLSNQKLSGKKIIALLPGSRKQEISRLLPPMLIAAKRFPDYQFVIAGAPSFSAANTTSNFLVNALSQSCSTLLTTY